MTLAWVFAGTLERNFCAPRVSMGPDVLQFVLGSEGTLGIITEAHVRVRVRRRPCTAAPATSAAAVHVLGLTRGDRCHLQLVPEVQEFGSIVFPSFESGVLALRAIASRRCAPASIRLVDNTQFESGRAMKPESAHPSRDEWFEKAAKVMLDVRVRGNRLPCRVSQVHSSGAARRAPHKGPGLGCTGLIAPVPRGTPPPSLSPAGHRAVEGVPCRGHGSGNVGVRGHHGRSESAAKRSVQHCLQVRRRARWC